MASLAIFHWSILLGAVLLGLAMGWIAVVQRNAGLGARALQLIAVLIGVLLALSFTHLLPGRAGYWLDLALVMFVVYLAGCTIGSLLRAAVVARAKPASPKA